jgi:hypothetical protein
LHAADNRRDYWGAIPGESKRSAPVARHHCTDATGAASHGGPDEA